MVRGSGALIAQRHVVLSGAALTASGRSERDHEWRKLT
jgi:hypothetical protein